MHRNHLVEYYPKEDTLTPMIEEFLTMDRRHDDFYEKFKEQRIQKINNPEQFDMEESLLSHFLLNFFVQLRLQQKPVSNTSSDSGVTSPHVLSPAMPITPDNSQPHLKPTTSRMNPPSELLTPIQQFTKNNRKSKNKELKYNRSQPLHPDPQSVLRTCTRQG